MALDEFFAFCERSISIDREWSSPKHTSYNRQGEKTLIANIPRKGDWIMMGQGKKGFTTPHQNRQKLLHVVCMLCVCVVFLAVYLCCGVGVARVIAYKIGDGRRYHW